MNKKLHAVLTATPFFLIGCGPQGIDPGTGINPGDDFADGYTTEANDLLAADLSDIPMNWKYTSGLPQVTTGFENNSETAGLWQLPESSEQVKISWGIGGEKDADIETALKKCGGVCGTFEVPKNYSGTVVNGAFFNIVGNDENGKVVAADVSEWGGICIVYESDHDGSISLISDELVNGNVAGYQPAAKLPKASSAVGRCFNWSHFSQGNLVAKKTRIAANTGEDFTKNLARVQVNFNVSNGDNVGTFNIKAIASYIDPDATSPKSSSSVTSSSSSETQVSAIDGLNGRLMRWVGADGDYLVETGLDVGTYTSGYWFSYSDDSDGGKSKIEWPVKLGNDLYEKAIDPVVDYCGGLCGTYILDRGTFTYDPYVGVGFNVGGEDDSGSLAVVDASAWNGVCVAYTSDSPIKVEMSLGDAVNAEIGYDFPYVTMPKSETAVAKCYKWSQFSSGWGANSGTTAAEKLVALHFKIQSKTGTTGAFNILGVSSNELTDGTPVKSSSSTASSSSTTIVSGHVIGTGCNDSMTGTMMKWCGDEETSRIETGHDVGTETSGYWYVFGDDADGGASRISWPVEPDWMSDEGDPCEPIVEACHGVCGTFSLNKGTLDSDPFVVVGFNIGGEDAESGIPVAVDVSSWGGVCVTYAADNAMTIEMGLGDIVDEELGQDLPFVSLSKSPNGATKCFNWSQFKQAGFGASRISGEEAAAKLVAVRFKIQGASGLAGNFNIMAVSSVN